MSILRRIPIRLFSLIGTALAITMTVTTSHAQDALRGAFSGETSPAPDWAGYYAGVHAGITAGKVTPSENINASLVEQALPANLTTATIANTFAFGSNTQTKSLFGAFIGFNTLWDEVVLGFEADYTRSNFSQSSSGASSARVVTSLTQYFPTDVTYANEAKLKEWVTLRGRVGQVMGNFMPYFTAGLALGNAQSSYSTSITQREFQVDVALTPDLADDTLIAGPYTGTATKKHRGINYGGVVGAGIEMQLVPNTFLRAEWQYIQFASGGDRPSISINTARIGGGVKF